MNRLSLYLNIILLTLLIVVVIRENYIPKLKQRIFPDNSLDHFKNRPAYKEELMRYDVYSKKANIVMVGTSLTQDIDWSELLNRGDIINRGFGGDIFAVIASRLPYVLSVKPKICFIEGGINDIDRNIPLKESMEHLTHIINSLQQDSIIPVITLVTHVSNSAHGHDERNQKINEINSEIKNLAKLKNISLIDNNPILAPDGYLKPEYAKYDGLHYLPKTYLVWKASIEKILMQYHLYPFLI